MLQRTMNDLRCAFRQLLKNAAFTAVAVLTLALGIGANTAIFSVVNALILQRLPYREPEQIVQVLSQNEKTGSRSVWISPPDFVDLGTQSEAFQEIAGWREWTLVDRQDGEPVSVRGAAITTNLFILLGVQPYLGRMFFSEEAQTADERVVILTHGFWQRRFGADAKIIGKAFQFGDQTYLPVGVTAPDFKFPTEPAFPWEPELFVPLWFRPVGEDRSSSSIHVPFKQRMSLALTGVAIGLALAFSVNQRAREIGIRVALGAQRQDVLSLVVGQGLRLALIGSVVGLIGALAATRLVSNLLFGVTPTDP